MGKYNLVASYYDLYRKEFLNEIVINIPNMDLTCIEKIDNYTSQFNESEIIENIKKYNNLTNQNMLSIRYNKTKDSKSNYYKVIYNNKLINNLSKNTHVELIGNKQHSYANAVEMNIGFSMEFKEIEEILNNKDLEKLINYFGEFHPIIPLCKNYLNCDPYDYEGIEQCKNQVKREFSRYKTFRGYEVAKTKKYNYKKSSIKHQTEKPIIVDKKDKKQLEKELISYREQVLNNYNIRDLDEDKEEFIEDAELDQMGYDTGNTK